MMATAKIVKRVHFDGIGEIAKEIGRNRAHVSRVIHGKRKSAPLVALLKEKYGITCKRYRGRE